MVVLAHIYFSGLVQGVGFRYTANRIASQLGLVGWVKNLNDGRVEMMAEGEKQDIDQMIHSLGQHFAGGIREQNIALLPPTGQFERFDIAH